MGLLRSSGWLPVWTLLVSSNVVGLAKGLANPALATDEILIAQITPDATLGDESSVLTPGVEVRGLPADLIEGGATRNSNLFHSFLNFSVDAGQRVYFASPSGIFDIYTRVTGNTPSSILGTLGVDGGADLFLINPSGVVFGPDSQLDVTGSFIASTAERLVFSDGSTFSTIDPDAAPLLQINVTPGLQYGPDSSAAITNQGNLAVGQNLTLGAPLLSLSGALTAGQDIILQGASRQLSEADYIVGGYLFTQELDGTGVEMVIPHTQVIVADGDVELEANYNGPSLHILAGGQVTQESAVETITVTGGTGGSVTETLSDGDGGIQSVTVFATDQPTVDIRSGVDWLSLTGALPGNMNTSGLTVSFSEATDQGITLDTLTNHGGVIFLKSTEDITASLFDTSMTVTSVNENVVGQDGGPITLIAGRDIDLTGEGILGGFIYLEGNLRAFSLTESENGNVIGGNGGNTLLIAGQDISSPSLRSYSSTSTSSGAVTGGNGGVISLSAGHNISSTEAVTYSRTSSTSTSSGAVTGGNGGVISLSAGHNIFYVDADSYSISDQNAPSGVMKGGNGGAVSLLAGYDIVFAYAESYSSGSLAGGDGGVILLRANRDITISELNSFSLAGLELNNPNSVIAGHGGAITVETESGSLFGERALEVMINSDVFLLFPDTDVPPRILTFSVAENGPADLGGNVSLQAATTIRNLEILTTSSSAQSGNVTITGLGDLSLQNLDIFTSQIVEIDDPTVFFPPRKLIIPVGGTGQPGAFTITGSGNLTFTDSTILSTTNSLNPAGIITITSPRQLTFTNNSEIRSEAENIGAAGSILLNAPQILIDQGSVLSTSTTNAGTAGDITIDTNTLKLINGGQILSPTSGTGNGGSVTIQASEAVNLGEGVQNFEPIISVETSGAGTPGDIAINTPQFTLSETARLTATATDTATNLEGGGSITLSANTMDLAGIVGIFAETQSQTPGGTLTLEPYRPNPEQPVTAPDLSVSFEEGSEISASTSSSGPGGNLLVRAPDSIILSGPGELAVETTGPGRAGTISLSSQDLTIQDGLTISAATQGGPGGNITITGNDNVHIENSIVTSEVLEGGENDGGAIKIFAGNLDLTNRTDIRTASNGSGSAGDITVTVDDTFQAQDSNLLTNSETTAGGIITVNAPNVRLFGDSDIVSFVNSGADGGGNITFNGDTVIALDDSDILSFAADGRGGNIIFNTAFFGEDFIPGSPPPFDGNDRVDVNASGAINGEISFTDVSFIENSLSELADTLVDPNTLTAGSCIARTTDNTGSFITTGTDGLPQRPGDVAAVQFPSVQIESLSNEESALPWNPEMPIVEPTDVHQFANGRIVLSRKCSHLID
ncbi:MAG: filamentous hemagglutinin N-terminal domain-containing protein [Cyanobacteria bacterium P01_B01_bin.77]